MYLLHFPGEQCFKVGLTTIDSSRISRFLRHGAIEVQRVTVSSRPLAEVVEADVLFAVQAWHKLGEPDRFGGGYTEMWSDDGPTVDLRAAAFDAEKLVEHIRHLCETG